MRILFIGILLLCIPSISKGQNQDLSIDFSYDKQSNSLLLNLCNNTDKEIIIRNQYQKNEFAGSFIILNQKINNRKTFSTICVFNTENGKWIPIKKLAPKAKMKLTYSFDAIPASNVYKAELNMLTFSKDEKTNIVTTKTYKKGVNTAQ